MMRQKLLPWQIAGIWNCEHIQLWACTIVGIWNCWQLKWSGHMIIIAHSHLETWFQRKQQSVRVMASSVSSCDSLPSSEDDRKTTSANISITRQSSQRRSQPKSRFTVEFVRSEGVEFHLGEVNSAMTPDHSPSERSMDGKKPDDEANPPPYHLADLYDRTYCYHRTLETLPNADHYHVAEGNKFKQRRTLSELLAPIRDVSRRLWLKQLHYIYKIIES